MHAYGFVQSTAVGHATCLISQRCEVSTHTVNDVPDAQYSTGQCNGRVIQVCNVTNKALEGFKTNSNQIQIKCVHTWHTDGTPGRNGRRGQSCRRRTSHGRVPATGD